MTIALRDRIEALVRRWFGLSRLEAPAAAPLPSLVAEPWSLLARMVIALNIDRATPGGLR